MALNTEGAINKSETAVKQKNHKIIYEALNVAVISNYSDDEEVSALEILIINQYISETETEGKYLVNEEKVINKKLDEAKNGIYYIVLDTVGDISDMNLICEQGEEITKIGIVGQIEAENKILKYIDITEDGKVYVKNLPSYYMKDNFPVKYVVIPNAINGITVKNFTRSGLVNDFGVGFSHTSIEAIVLPSSITTIPWAFADRVWFS